MPADLKPIVEPSKADQGEIISSDEGMDRPDPHPAEEGAPYNTGRTDRSATGAKAIFSPQEVAQIKKLLEEAANEPPRSSAPTAVIGMLNDKIAALASDGLNYDEIGALLTQITGATISAEQLAQCYAAPQGR